MNAITLYLFFHFYSLSKDSIYIHSLIHSSLSCFIKVNITNTLLSATTTNVISRMYRGLVDS